MLGQGRRGKLAPCVIVAVALVATSFVVTGLAWADGSETLGPPSIPISSGSGVVAAGTGTVVQPATIEVAVPDGATVRQVLLYWEGQHGSLTDADDAVRVNGVDIAGQLIGGPNYFFDSPAGAHYSSTYRADISQLSVVAAGPNALTITGMDFNRANGGAGVMVVYADGTTSDLGIVDGNDLAFRDFPDPRRTTVPQTFTFPAASAARTATLNVFASSVEGQDFPGQRPSVIYVESGGEVSEFVNVLASNDGDEWDTFTTPVGIPAGATSLSIQIVSNDVLLTGNLPASLAWNAAWLSVPRVTPPPPPGGGSQGCTPGYWGRPQHLGSWTGYAPTDSYRTVFGVQSSFDLSLIDTLNQGGGGEAALGRHAVAALLNASNPAVDYKYTAAQVIDFVKQAYASGDFEGTKNTLEVQNEIGCPLGRADATDDGEIPPKDPAGPKVIKKLKTPR